MPLYDYRCPTCGRGREVMLKLADINSPVYCQQCGSGMNRKVTAPMVVNDYPGYESPVTGEWIEGRRAHEEHLKRTGCRIYEPGETDQFKNRQRAADAALDNKIEESVDRYITSLPTEKRDRLAAELEGGLTTQIERSAPTFK